MYAGLRPRPEADWKGLSQSSEELPLGKIVGTVEIVGCEKLGDRDYAWVLRSPKRLRAPVSPKAHPQPVWFFPFGK